MSGRHIAFGDLDEALRLQAPGGGQLAVTAREITLTRDGGRLVECRATFELDHEAYGIVDREHLFHLAPEVRGPGSDRFEPVKVVRIGVRLAPDLLPLVDGMAPRAAGQILAELSRDGAASPLLSTESWFALSVASPVELPEELRSAGTLEDGYATTWAEAERKLRLPMLLAAAEVLDRNGWDYEEADDDSALVWSMRNPAGTWRCRAVADEDDDYFAVYSDLEIAVPTALRPSGAELIARVNHGLPIGNWEIDMDDGSIRFKTSIDVAGDRLSVALAGRLIEDNLEVVDSYLLAFVAFCEGRLSAEEAVTLAED